MVHDYYNAYDSTTGRWPKVVMICLVAALIAGGGFWMLTRGGDAAPRLSALDPPATADGPGTASDPSPAPVAVAPVSSTATPSSAAPTSAPAPGSAPPTSAPAPSSVPALAAAPPATAPATAPAPPDTAAPPAAPEGGDPGYPTSSDGSPLPLIVTYDTDTITITGFVPSEEAKARIGLLATANSKTEARLENHLVVNPAVPIGVGVRVIELNSVRFPEGSSEILPAHAAELERVATVMETLPNVTVLVIGHADQRGDEAANFTLSAERAGAVVDFLTYLGVSPTRLSSRAAGEADLLTLADDDAALALNRRTEFVFYGVLVE